MNWYTASTGNHQGLVIDEETGRNVAVAYDKKDASLIAAAPALLAALVNAVRCGERDGMPGNPGSAPAWVVTAREAINEALNKENENA
jgi:hypothetical protein